MNDLRWFRRYYEDVFAEGGGRARLAYVRTLERLVAAPRIGRPLEFENVREFPIQRTPFSVIYRLQEDRIEILRIWDQRADDANRLPEES